MSEWLDRLAANLEYIESEIRAALLAIERGRPHPRLIGPMRDILIRRHEARILLRGAMPAPIAGTRLRQPHARMVAALQLFGSHLVALNSPVHPRAAAIAAAADLVDALQDWTRRAAWAEASRRAGTRWPVPVTPIMRRDTPAPAAQKWNIDLPSAPMGRHLDPAHGLREVLARRSPDLFDRHTHGPVTDIRQLALDLPPARAAA